MTTDPFESDLAARMGAAAEPVAADGVTRDGIASRVAARRSARRRRQGALVAVAAAAVVALGAVAALASGGEPSTTVNAEEGGATTTEAPTTDGPATTVTGGCDDTLILPDPVDGSTAAGSCVGTTTPAPTTEPSTTEPPATSTEPPPTTEAPPTTVPPVTEAPPTTVAPRATLASETALAFVRGVIAGRDVSGLVDDGGFDPVADMRSELPEDLSGFVAAPVDIMTVEDWETWGDGAASQHPEDPACADVGDGSVACIISVTRPDFSLFLDVYMTRDEPWRVRVVDSGAD